MNYFNDPNMLEPKCPRCGVVLDYGTNTEYSDSERAHICKMCNHVLR